MFDLNKIVTDALNAAVAEAIRPLVNRIDDLENMLQHKLLDRLAAVENNPAIGVDTTLLDRVVALEEGCVGIDQRLLEQRVALLEERPATAVAGVITPEMIVESMNKAEWLWEKVNAYIETGIEDRIERAIDDHCGTYDHDDYDRHISDDDIHIDGDLEDAVTDAVRNLTFEVSVS